MLNKLEQAKEEWGGTLSIIDTWLEARQKCVVLYCQLAGLPPYIGLYTAFLPVIIG